MDNRIVVVAVIALIALVLGVIFWPGSPEPDVPLVPPEEVEAPEPEPEPPEPELAPVPEPPEEPEAIDPPLILPRLNESDQFVRERAEALDDGRTLAGWLDREELIRRFATVIDNAGDGLIPRRQLDFLAPQSEFPVVEENDTIYLDEAGYGRYDRFVETVTGIDPERAAGLIHTLSPLIAQAVEELGYPQPEPYARIDAAIEEALAAPVFEERIELVQPSVTYEYADPALEALSPLQKQLLRMGPENTRRLQSYLGELREALADVRG